MSEEVVVFLGPTLHAARAEKILPALYLAPASQGDLFGAARTLKPRTIVLVDGVFGWVPAVRHKEILWVIEQGIEVYGAGSMGAIRAAELDSFGMRGHGFVYRWYKQTAFADDDEVAVAMMPAEIGAGPLSEALINIRLTLRLAERVGLISRAKRRALEDIARAMHFFDRSYPNLFERAHAAFPGWKRDLAELQSWIDANAVDQKRSDTIALLNRLAAGDVGARSPLPRVSQPVPITAAWAHDLRDAGADLDGLLT